MKIRQRIFFIIISGLLNCELSAQEIDLSGHVLNMFSSAFPS
jgi:hypothetical protein